jgi:hypothetical protein
MWRRHGSFLLISIVALLTSQGLRAGICCKTSKRNKRLLEAASYKFELLDPTLTEAIGYVWKHPYYTGQANIKLVKNSIIIHKVITVVLVVTSLVLVL